MIDNGKGGRTGMISKLARNLIVLVVLAVLGCVAVAPSVALAEEVALRASLESDEVNVYRLYNWRSSEHLYTTSKTEYDNLPIRTLGDWVQEGVAWVAPKTSSSSVWRLYNSGLGDHHYTASKSERDLLVNRHGWTDEGVAFYSDTSQRVSLYRLYNSGLKKGQHHYTSDAGERDKLVRNHGWKAEGVGFYGMREGTSGPSTEVPAGTYRQISGLGTSGSTFTLTIRSDMTWSEVESYNGSQWEEWGACFLGYEARPTYHSSNGYYYDELYKSNSNTMALRHDLADVFVYYTTVLWDASSQRLYVIEVDENGHRDYYTFYGERVIYEKVA